MFAWCFFFAHVSTFEQRQRGKWKKQIKAFAYSSIDSLQSFFCCFRLKWHVGKISFTKFQKQQRKLCLRSYVPWIMYMVIWLWLTRFFRDTYACIQSHILYSFAYIFSLQENRQPSIRVGKKHIFCWVSANFFFT